jgi:hypothetical protein
MLSITTTEVTDMFDKLTSELLDLTATTQGRPAGAFALLVLCCCSSSCGGGGSSGSGGK